MATLTQLEYLVAVDRFRHFGKAAKACHVSQPTLSMQLQKLEEEYGLTFFDRSKQPILPTQEGLAVIEQAKSVLREVGKLDHICRNRTHEPSANHSRPRLGCFVGTFSPSCRQIRSTRLSSDFAVLARRSV